MITLDTSWLPERAENRRTMEAMLRRQEWLAFVARLELGWYASWRAVLTEAPPSPPISPFKPWLYNWGDMRR
jgi:hypothetical protein